MTGRSCFSGLALIGWGIATLAQPSSGLAQSSEAFKGKDISVYIGSTTGGGYDQYARLLARHIGMHLPGAPKVIPRNMPADRQLMNHIYNIAPKDGTSIATAQRNAIFDPIFYESENFQFEATKLTWLGSMNSEVSVCVVWHSTPFKSLADTTKSEVIFGASGAVSTGTTNAKMLNEMVGTKIKTIEGYPGSTEVMLAMERGEVHGRCGLGWDSIKSRYQSWLDDKKIVVLAQFAVDKHPDLPDVPFVMDMARNDDDRAMLVLSLGPGKMGRPYFAPPNLPRERVELLRRAFDASMTDPQLLADAAKMKVEIDWMNGEAVQAMVANIYNTPKAIVEKVRLITAGK